MATTRSWLRPDPRDALVPPPTCAPVMMAGAARSRLGANAIRSHCLVLELREDLVLRTGGSGVLSRATLARSM